MNWLLETATSPLYGAVDKVVSENLQWEFEQKKDAHRRHFMAHINRFKFKEVAERRQ